MNTVTYVTYRTCSRMTRVPRDLIHMNKATYESWIRLHTSHIERVLEWLVFHKNESFSQKHDSSIWVIHMNAFLRGMYRKCMCDVADSYVTRRVDVWHGAFLCVTRRIHLCHPYECIPMRHIWRGHSLWHGIFICGMPCCDIAYSYDITYSYVTCHIAYSWCFSNMTCHIWIYHVSFSCVTRHATSHAGGVFPLRFVATKVARRCLYIYMYVYMHGIGMSHV